MRFDRGPLDRSGLDRQVTLNYYTLFLAIAGTGSISSLLVDREIPLSISGTGAISNPALLRLISLDVAGTGSFAWDFRRIISVNIYGTGAYLYTNGTTISPHALMLDRGRIDRGSVCGCYVNQIPPVIVDRSIPLAISGTGSFSWDFCRLYNLAISGTGLFSSPLVNRGIVIGFTGTGIFSVLNSRTYLLDIYGTGKFTSEEFTKTYDLYISGTGHFDDPTVFIPVHYLTAAISGTGQIWDPAVLREISNISALIKGGSVRRSLAEKMFTASIEFAEKYGTTSMSINPWQKITFYQPDYTGNFNPIFVGIFPTSRQNITPVSMTNLRAESEVIIAYDYAWYLSAQLLTNWVDGDGMPHNEQILLTPADQAKQIIHNLAFDTVSIAFKVGQWVVGGTSGDAGMIIEINAGGLSNHIRLEYLTPTGKAYYFQNDEALKVGGTTYAYADGHSTDETGTPATMYPEDYVKELLGGASAGVFGVNWQYTTGIYPYRMNNITVGWTLMPAVEFPFTLQTTKAQAIEKICKYCRAVFYVKWRNDISGYEGTYLPAAYLVKQSEIDDAGTGLDLPAAADCTFGGGVSSADLGRYMKGTFVSDFKGEDQYNWVSIRCQDLNGLWLESHKVAGVTYGVSVYDPVENPTGTEIKRSYYEENAEIFTQASLDDRADDIYAYYHYQINTWKATFYKRSDLQLLQQVTISGFGASVIPDGTYRIIDIQYDYAEGGTSSRSPSRTR